MVFCSAITRCRLQRAQDRLGAQRLRGLRGEQQPDATLCASFARSKCASARLAGADGGDERGTNQTQLCPAHVLPQDVACEGGFPREAGLVGHHQGSRHRARGISP